MKINCGFRRKERREGFTLLDIALATGLAGVMFVSLYAGLTTGFTIVKMGRENTRATQILMEKMETIRLYTWDQITSNGFIPTNFTATYYPPGLTNAGLTFTGRVTIADSGIGSTYADDLKRVTVELKWATGSLLRSRTNSTLVSHYGLQNYIY